MQKHCVPELVQWESKLLTAPKDRYLADICSSVQVLLFSGGHVCSTVILQLVIIVATDQLTRMYVGSVSRD